MKIFYVDENDVITPQDPGDMESPKTRKKLYSDLGEEIDLDFVKSNYDILEDIVEDLSDCPADWQEFIEEDQKLPKSKRVLKVSRAKKSKDGKALPRHCCWLKDGRTLFEFDEPAPDRDTVYDNIQEIIDGAHGSIRSLIDSCIDFWLDRDPTEEELGTWAKYNCGCFYSFDGLSKEDRDALGIELVDGDGPGCDTQYARLCRSIDEANAAAAERGLDIRFVSAD
ncbi:MAG: hypothetical protein ACFWTZ_08275 [Burkholderia sp.]|jgi:hypothetical protein